MGKRKTEELQVLLRMMGEPNMPMDKWLTAFEVRRGNRHLAFWMPTGEDRWALVRENRDWLLADPTGSGHFALDDVKPFWGTPTVDGAAMMFSLANLYGATVDFASEGLL